MYHICGSDDAGGIHRVDDDGITALGDQVLDVGDLGGQIAGPASVTIRFTPRCSASRLGDADQVLVPGAACYGALREADGDAFKVGVADDLFRSV